MARTKEDKRKLGTGVSFVRCSMFTAVSDAGRGGERVETRKILMGCLDFILKLLKD